MTQVKKQDDTRLNLASHDAVGERIEQLKMLLPEIFVEGQIDPEQLRLHLGDFSKVGAERYGLNWAGKADAIRNLQIPSHGTLVPLKDQSVNFDESENMIIEGDNLEVLKLLQKSYHGKIKMIYIDPPYNTGGDFIYPDNFKEGLETYLKYSGQATEGGFKVSTNSENGGRYHSNWLNMMYPRLFMAKNLLRDDGVIFISISHHELHNLRAIMNEIFGEENFIENFIWRKKSGGGQQDEFAVNEHEYIVCYARLKTAFRFNERTATAKMTGYNQRDSKTGKNYKLVKLAKWGSAALREDRPTMYDYPELLDPDGNQAFPKAPDGRPGRWRYGRTRAKELLRDGLIEWVKQGEEWLPYEKEFEPSADDGQSLKERSIFYDLVENTEGANELTELYGVKDVFQNPKPSDLIAHLINLSTSENDIVLDFFAGSGSSAHGAITINKIEGITRKFILIQLPEPIDPAKKESKTALDLGFKNISEITRDRVKKVIEVEKTLDFDSVGFKAFRLTSSNFKLWDASGGSKDADGLAKQLDAFADNLLPGRSQDDILYEVILKAGQPLTAKIEKIDVAGQKVFSIDGGAMLICLEDPIKEETLVGMLEYQPAIMVALDKAFHGNDQLKTNIKLQAEATGESEQSRVLFKTV